MRPPRELPGNRGVLGYLAQGSDAVSVEVAPPPGDVDIFRLGAHPDVIEWLWRDLNTVMPGDARSLVAGGAALVQPETGLILAVALGTRYAIRLTRAGLRAARDAGYETEHTFRSVGRTLDLAATFGPGWYFGQFDRREGEWLVETYRATNL